MSSLQREGNICEMSHALETRQIAIRWFLFKPVRLAWSTHGTKCVGLSLSQVPSLTCQVTTIPPHIRWGSECSVLTRTLSRKQKVYKQIKDISRRDLKRTKYRISSDYKSRQILRSHKEHPLTETRILQEVSYYLKRNLNCTWTTIKKCEKKRS